MIDNSLIKESLDKNTLAAELILQIHHPNNANKIFILFEGGDDIDLMAKFFTCNCFAFESYGGKNDIIDMLCESTFSDKRLIGIVDKDYSSLIMDRLFYCDYCNAEMMVVSNQIVFDAVMNTYMKKRQSHSTFLTNYLGLLAPLAAIRKRNEEQQLGIKFNPDIKRIIRETQCCLNDFINMIDDENLKKDFAKNPSEYTIQEVLVRTNPINFINGHDFCGGLSAAIKKYLYSVAKSRCNPSEDDVRSRLYLAFDANCFKSTKLFTSLEAYTNENGLIDIFSD